MKIHIKWTEEKRGVKYEGAYPTLCNAFAFISMNKRATTFYLTHREMNLLEENGKIEYAEYTITLIK